MSFLFTYFKNTFEKQTVFGTFKLQYIPELYDYFTHNIYFNCQMIIYICQSVHIIRGITQGDILSPTRFVNNSSWIEGRTSYKNHHKQKNVQYLFFVGNEGINISLCKKYKKCFRLTFHRKKSNCKCTRKILWISHQFYLDQGKFNSRICMLSKLFGTLRKLNDLNGKHSGDIKILS